MMLKYMIILFIFPVRLWAFGASTDSACIPAVSISESQNNICAGTAVTLQAIVSNDGTNGGYRWKKNNLDAGAGAINYYTSTDFHDGDIVLCEYSCKTACGVDTTVVSNPVTIHVVNDVIPLVTVGNYDTLICEGNLTVFSVTAFYGNLTPFYQWTVNGTPVGTNSPTYSTSTITNGAEIDCMLTVSTPACPGFTRSAISKLTIYVYPLIHPAIKITPSKAQICRGEEVTFTATANGGSYPSFAWSINGISAGDNAPILRTSALKDGDIVSAVVTIDQDSRCHTTTSAPSNDVIIRVSDYTDPEVTIAAPVLDVCTGKDIVFTATPQRAGELKIYQWQINGRNANNNSSTFISNQFKSGDSVSCILTTSIPGCSITKNVYSNSEKVTIRELPVINFTPPEISVLYGEQAQLQASVSGGNITSFVWNPAGALLTPQSLTPVTIPLLQDTVFNLTVANSYGCTASGALAVKVLHRLYMPSAFSPNNDGRNDVFRIPPGASIALKEFSIFDRWGNAVFKTTDITKEWSGEYKGQILDPGIYIYLIKGVIDGKEATIKGTVTLVR